MHHDSPLLTMMNQLAKHHQPLLTMDAPSPRGWPMAMAAEVGPPPLLVILRLLPSYGFAAAEPVPGQRGRANCGSWIFYYEGSYMVVIYQVAMDGSIAMDYYHNYK